MIAVAALPGNWPEVAAEREKALEQLQSGLNELGQSEAVAERLLQYLELMVKWNRAYNLTAVRELGEMVPRHVLDSLSLLAHLPEEPVADIGSGAGLPGVPLAMFRPDQHFVLIDASAKRTRFLQEAKRLLDLNNVEIVTARVEQLEHRQFPVIVSRAFASLREFTLATERVLAPGGRWLAMKGLYPAEEISELDNEFKVESCHELRVPGLEEQRHLLVIGKDPTARNTA